MRFIREGVSGSCWRHDRSCWYVRDAPAPQVKRKGRRFRELQTVPIGLKRVWLVTEVPQCECLACGQSFEVSPLLPRLMSGTRTGSKPLSKACGG